jgi:hypothetical protein
MIEEPQSIRVLNDSLLRNSFFFKTGFLRHTSERDSRLLTNRSGNGSSARGKTMTGGVPPPSRLRGWDTLGRIVPFAGFVRLLRNPVSSKIPGFCGSVGRTAETRF